MRELILSGENLNSLLDTLLNREHSCSVKVFCKGFSMSPFIKDSDSIIIRPVEKTADLKIGDIVAVAVSRGKIIIHRIIRLEKKFFMLKGDNLTYDDGWFGKQDVIGIVEIVFKKNNFRYKPDPLINYVIAIGSRTKILNHLLAFFRRFTR